MPGLRGSGRGGWRVDFPPDGQAHGVLLLIVRSVILFSMSLHHADETADLAVLSGGPMDGRQHSIENDPAELDVVLTDGQQHRYRRTNEVQRLPDGRSAVVFEWAGRYYGPK
jgi:hypothetical protein